MDLQQMLAQLRMQFTVFWPSKQSCFALWMLIWCLSHLSASWAVACKARSLSRMSTACAAAAIFPSFSSCCFFRASLSNPTVDPTGNLIAPDLFRCSSRWNKYLLKALPSEEPSPLQLPSAFAKCPPLMCTHRTSFSFVSFIWGNSWTTPAVSLRKQFRKWGDNLSPSWALRLARGRVAD